MTNLKDVNIDYSSFGDDVDPELIREWVADEYTEGEILAINDDDDGIVLREGTAKK